MRSVPVGLRAAASGPYLLILADVLLCGSGMGSTGCVQVLLFLGGSGGLPPSETTFAKRLQQQGYTTGLVGEEASKHSFLGLSAVTACSFSQKRQSSWSLCGRWPSLCVNADSRVAEVRSDSTFVFLVFRL